MLWSILIATHASRSAKLQRLFDVLAPQLTPEVEGLVLWNRGLRTIGEYRQALLEEAKGEYVSHVDDDDLVPDYYCAEILAALESRPDYVGFELAYTDLTKKRTLRSQHSLRNPGWSEGGFEYAFLRDVSHLNPIRKDIATFGGFTGHRGEDREWAESIRGRVASEVYIDRVMYRYEYDRNLSIRRGNVFGGSATRPVLPEGFRFHPASE